MKYYTVMVKIPAGEDDYLDVEYSGIHHTEYKEAFEELCKVTNCCLMDLEILDAYIDERENNE